MMLLRLFTRVADYFMLLRQLPCFYYIDDAAIFRVAATRLMRADVTPLFSPCCRAMP